MKEIKRIALLALSIIMVLSIFSGCSKSDTKLDIIYPFDGNINSFDPQVASTADEFLIAENCFEGLVRVLDDGTVKPGVATDWSISDDGLTYTFNLRKGAKWNVKSSKTDELSAVQKLMGEDFNPDITADDFVFALQRAVDKTTDSALYSSVSNIKNASKIHSGKMNTKSLGVKAINDYKLQITLNSPDSGFMQTLSTSVAMPCNSDYFYATKGRYGLGLEYSIFNGPFAVSLILDTSYTLKNNSQYVGDSKTDVSDITLKITDEESKKDIAKNLESGYYDCAYISGEQYLNLSSKDISVKPYSNKTWALILNKNKLLFGNKKLRQAVCLSVSQANLQDVKYLTAAQTLTPPSCIISNTSADKALGTTVTAQNTEKAIELWKEGLNETGYSIADLDVIVPEGMEEIAKQLVQGIQGSIGEITNYGDDNKVSFSLKLTTLNESDYKTAFNNNDYDIALYEFEASNQSALTFLSDIINGNYIGEVKSAQTALKNAESASSTDYVKACKKCEKAILNDYSIVPVMYESSYYAQAKGVSGIQFHPGSGRIDFINAKREK